MGFMLRPVCIKDQVEYKVEECGVALVEYFKSDGTLKPYNAYFADLWVCPVCGHKILGGYGKPVVQHHEKEKMQKFLDKWADLGKLYVVK